MAGDWIKLRHELFTHPKVVRMASALKADNLRTVGGLMSAWCLFDAHSEDGVLEGYTCETLDDHLRWPGFSEAMLAIRWLEIRDVDGLPSLALPSFETHNGKSAKRRAQDTERHRNVRKLSASQADKTGTREEKRREEPKVGKILASEQNLERANGACALAENGDWGGHPATDHQASEVVKASIALRRIGMQVQPAMPQLLDVVARGCTIEQMCLTAAELALRKANLLNDPDVHPELLDLCASGATQAQMCLTAAHYAALRAGMPGMSYLAKTLIGRAEDAARQGEAHVQSTSGGRGAGRGSVNGSASGRAEAARRAGDAREAARAAGTG